MNLVPLILTVEDDDTLRYLIMRQLRKLGYQAHYATTGTEAVRMVQDHRYSLILMDVMMPEMDGLEATSQIRSFQQQRQTPTPIVAMTAFQDKARCTAGGMDDYIFKPVMIDDLAQKLRDWLPSDSSNQQAKNAG